MIALTAAIAVVIAIPAHIHRQLMRINELAPLFVVYSVLIVLLVLLMVILVIWLVIRGPTAYARLVDAFVRWRGLKHHRDELRK